MPIYNLSQSNASEYANNDLDSIAIVVYPGGCLPITKYAIYAAISPVKIALNQIVDTAYAAIGSAYDATKYAGYICIDSTGHVTSSAVGRIAEPVSANRVSLNDGLCH